MSDSGQDKPIVKSFKDLKMEKLKWLWPNRFPLGKLALLVGDQNKGKSLLTLYMAAQISTGRPWIDSSKPRPPADVIILTTEDALNDTVGPRLKVAGADLSRVHYIEGIESSDPNKKQRGLHNLTKDFTMLAKAVQEYPQTKFVIIDPISGYMTGKNENKNAEVREYLNPLADLARIADLSIIGISHLNKNQMTQMATYRVLGSVAFTAAARAVWLVESDPEDETRRLFVPHKANLCKNPTGLAFTIMSSQVKIGNEIDFPPYCAFSPEPIYLTAQTLLAPKNFEKKSPKKDAIEEWLLEYLADGPKLANDIYNIGSQMGFKKRTLDTVKARLKIQAIKLSGFGGEGKWEWALPS